MHGFSVKKPAQGFGTKTFAGFWFKNLCLDIVQKSTQGFGAYNFQCFAAKTCAGFWCKNLCMVFVFWSFFGVYTCAEFWCKNLRMVFVEKRVHSFGRKNLSTVLVQNSFQCFSG